MNITPLDSLIDFENSIFKEKIKIPMKTIDYIQHQKKLRNKNWCHKVGVNY
jgi:hypothetical protein